jgi:hypothetical protein
MDRGHRTDRPRPPSGTAHLEASQSDCIFGCRVYTHANSPLGTLDARGEEMRYLGFSHDPNFHHLYRARDRRVFTTDDVTFVETDIQLPEYSGNMEIELAGLLPVTAEEERLIDAHAERDDEVNWDQLSLDSIHQQYAEADDTPLTSLDRAGDTPLSIEPASVSRIHVLIGLMIRPARISSRLMIRLCLVLIGLMIRPYLSRRLMIRLCLDSIGLVIRPYLSRRL